MPAPVAIPERLRRTVLAMTQSFVEHEQLIGAVGGRFGFVSEHDLLEALDQVLGDDEGLAYLDRRATEQNLLDRSLGSRRRAVTNDPIGVLMALPDAWFIVALDAATSVALEVDYAAFHAEPHAPGFPHAVSRLFAENGVPFEFEGASLVRRGDPVLASLSVQPGLSALGDPRLADANSHFRAALSDERRGDPDDAVDEARQAIEAALIALLQDHGAPLPDRNQAQRLFDACVEHGVLDRRLERIVLGAPGYRNKSRAGHAGLPPALPEHVEPVLAVAAAGLMIVASALR